MKRTPLKKASKSYAKALETYRKHTKPMWLELHPRCEFIILGEDSPMRWACGANYNVTVHHKMGRGKYLNDMRYFMTACPECHDWIESNKRKARELGYILYK